MSSRSMVLSLLFTLFYLGGAHAASEESSSQKALREHYDLHEGKRLYEQYCRFCHGEQGKGKAFDVTPPPADLTSPAVQQKSDSTSHRSFTEVSRAPRWGLGNGPCLIGTSRMSSGTSDRWLDDDQLRL